MVAGDEHFVEMSAFEAEQMLQRQRQGLQGKQRPAHSSKIESHDSPISEASTLAEADSERVFEISEEYDESLHGPLHDDSHAPLDQSPTGRSAAPILPSHRASLLSWPLGSKPDHFKQIIEQKQKTNS